MGIGHTGIWGNNVWCYKLEYCMKTMSAAKCKLAKVYNTQWNIPKTNSLST